MLIEIIDKNWLFTYNLAIFQFSTLLKEMWNSLILSSSQKSCGFTIA